MGYRNITVNNTKYEYSVGHSGVHIKLPQGGSIYMANRQIGIDRGDDKFTVTPACIRARIEELQAKASI